MQQRLLKELEESVELSEVIPWLVSGLRIKEWEARQEVHPKRNSKVHLVALDLPAERQEARDSPEHQEVLDSPEEHQVVQG